MSRIPAVCIELTTTREFPPRGKQAMSFEQPLDKLSSSAASTQNENIWSDIAGDAYKPRKQAQIQVAEAPVHIINGVAYPVTVLQPGAATNTLNGSSVGHFSYGNSTAKPDKPVIYGGFR
ncbi:MAG: hypothetical protein P4L53_25725 [Candidatus Obscuribacterales bacterium]|nr:hypothetical protein [Candidatus Obscuribacterales bacterium]